MEKFVTLTSQCVPLQRENVDTDQIIPARFLLMITKEGFGEHLFEDWRYNEDGSPKKDFILNDPSYMNAEILLAGENFGSGSSREHAVWALAQYGFRCVIAPSFSDIFRNNAYGNGLLVVTVTKEISKDLFERAKRDTTFQLTIDLPKQKIVYPDGKEIDFDIPLFIKERLIQGMDNIDYVLSKEEKIRKFEEEHA